MLGILPRARGKGILTARDLGVAQGRQQKIIVFRIIIDAIKCRISGLKFRPDVVIKIDRESQKPRMIPLVGVAISCFYDRGSSKHVSFKLRGPRRNTDAASSRIIDSKVQVDVVGLV